MPLLTPLSQTVAQRIINWDRARVDSIEARGFDVTIYRQRQALAEAAITTDTDGWSRQAVDLYMAVLEVFRTPTPVAQYGIGPLQHPVPRLNRAERTALKGLAAEIGVIGNLREVSPRQWADDDGED